MGPWRTNKKTFDKYSEECTRQSRKEKKAENLRNVEENKTREENKRRAEERVNKNKVKRKTGEDEEDTGMEEKRRKDREEQWHWSSWIGYGGTSSGSGSVRHEEVIYKCEICARGFLNESGKIAHKEKCKDETCGVCLASFEDHASLRRHSE